MSGEPSPSDARGDEDATTGTVAVVVIDMLNPYTHEDADELAANVADAIDQVAGLVAGAVGAGVHLVYVNDNYGDYAATRHDIAEAALAGRHPELVEPILPPDDVAFLQKVRHSAFYSTALDHLLRRREVDTVILTGQVTEQCILYTALDAYVRHYGIRVAQDAVAGIVPELSRAALEMMRRNMGVEILEADRCLAPAG